MRQPVSFVATAQPDKALPFYRDVLGLRLQEESPFALVFQEGAHSLRVQIVERHEPAAHTVHGGTVTDLKSEIANLRRHGVRMLRFAQLPQDAEGIWRAPQGHQIAWFSDPCGNILSFTQRA